MFSQEAEEAMRKMNGTWLGSRAIRCNWATRKNENSTGGGPSMTGPTPGRRMLLYALRYTISFTFTFNCFNYLVRPHHLVLTRTLSSPFPLSSPPSSSSPSTDGHFAIAISFSKS